MTSTQDTSATTTAIPFISLQSDKFVISPQARTFLSGITNPIAVLTIVGKYRTGKSLFLNRIMLGRAKAFKVSPTINSCTKGLWLWKGSIKVAAEGEKQEEKEVLVIDTEGFGATEESDAYNNKILLFALLLSSYFVYNSVGSIDQNSLNSISVLANLANDIQTKNTSDQQITQHFPSFLWLVRDFTLNLVDKTNTPILPSQYLQQALQIQKGTSNMIESKNRIRRMMKHFFKDRDCCTLVRPVETEEMLQQLDGLEEGEFRGEFLEQARALKSKILGKIKTKKLKGTVLNGEMFCELAQNYVDVVNSNSLPNFQSSYKHLLKLQLSTTKRRILHQTQPTIAQLIKTLLPTITTPQQLTTAKHSHLASLQTLTRQRIRTHPTLSAFVNTEEVTSLISEVRKMAGEGFDRCWEQERGFYEGVYKQAVDKVKEDNLMGDGLEGVCSEREFREFVDRVQCEVDHNVTKALQSQQHHSLHHPSSITTIPPLFAQTLHQQLFTPYKQHLTQQFAQLQSRRLFQSNNELKVKLEMKEETLREKHQLVERLEGEVREKDRVNRELQMRVALLENQVQATRSEAGEQRQRYQAQIQMLQEKATTLTTKNTTLTTQLSTTTLSLQQTRHLLSSTTSQLTLTSKQLSLHKCRLESMAEQLEEKKLMVERLRKEVEEKEGKVEEMWRKVEEAGKEKEEIRGRLGGKVEEMGNRIIMLQKTNSSLTTQLSTTHTHICTLSTAHTTCLSHLTALHQTNHTLQQSIQHLQSSLSLYTHKQQSYKNYKRAMKNSSSVQCRHCERFFMTGVFGTHLGVCSGYGEREEIGREGREERERVDREREEIGREQAVRFREGCEEQQQIQCQQQSGQRYQQQQQQQQDQQQYQQQPIIFVVTNTSTNSINTNTPSIPTTTYHLQCHQGPQTWHLSKTFTQLCQLNNSLQTSFPSQHLSEAQTVFDPKQMSKHQLSTEERQFLVGRFLNDLGRDGRVRGNEGWRAFLGLGVRDGKKREALREVGGGESSRNVVSSGGKGNSDCSGKNNTKSNGNAKPGNNNSHNSSNTSSMLNYQMMRRSQIKQDNNTNTHTKSNNNNNNKLNATHNTTKQSRRSSLHTPQQFFKIWQHKQHLTSTTNPNNKSSTSPSPSTYLNLIKKRNVVGYGEQLAPST